MASQTYTLRFKLPKQFIVNDEHIEMKGSLKELDDFTMSFFNKKELINTFLDNHFKKTQITFDTLTTNKKDIIDYFENNNLNIEKNIELIKYEPKYDLEIDKGILLLEDRVINNKDQMKIEINIFTHVLGKEDNFYEKCIRDLETGFIGEVIDALFKNEQIENIGKEQFKNVVWDLIKKEQFNNNISDLVNNQTKLKDKDKIINVLLEFYNTNKIYMNKNIQKRKNYHYYEKDKYICDECSLYEDKTKYSVLRRIYLHINESDKKYKATRRNEKVEAKVEDHLKFMKIEEKKNISKEQLRRDKMKELLEEEKQHLLKLYKEQFNNGRLK